MVLVRWRVGWDGGELTVRSNPYDIRMPPLRAQLKVSAGSNMTPAVPNSGICTQDVSSVYFTTPTITASLP